MFFVYRAAGILVAFSFFCLFLTNSICAQEKDNFVIAVLDVEKVFKGDELFNDAMKKLKTEAVQFAKDKKEEGEPSSEQKSSKSKALQLAGKEAELYSKTYKRMHTAVASICKQNDIKLVIRMAGKEHDAAKNPPTTKSEAQSIIKMVNRNIVYHNRLDITKMVIASMERDAKVLKNEACPTHCSHCGQPIEKLLADE